MFPYKNIIVVMSSPSGTGKSSIIREIMKDDENLRFSISATTRAPRSNEIDGKHYYFLSREVFIDKIRNNEFLEYAVVFGNYYGTLMSEIENNLRDRHDVIMDVDWQGARQITSRVKRSELIRIFILPPSMKELEDRLLSRNTDDRISINKRMDEAKNEIKHYNEYDYTIINDNFDKTVETVKSLILARRIGNTSKNEMRNFVKELCNYQY